MILCIILSLKQNKILNLGLINDNIKQRSLKEVKDDRERTLKEIQRGAEIAVKNLRGYFNHF